MSEMAEVFKKGEVVIVEKPGEEPQAAIVQSVETVRIFVNFGGVIALVHDDETLKRPPAEITEALRLGLELNQEELLGEMANATKDIRRVLEEYRGKKLFRK